MVSRRALEVATALVTGAFGVAILVASFKAGVGWSRAGVGAGTFPCIAGTLIIAGSLWNLVRGALHAGEAVLDRERLIKVAGVFLPAAAFVAAIPLLGLHVAAGLYVFGCVAWRKRTPLPRALALGIVVPVALYVVFDRGFQVALPRGLLGAALGF